MRSCCEAQCTKSSKYQILGEKQHCWFDKTTRAQAPLGKAVAWDSQGLVGLAVDIQRQELQILGVHRWQEQLQLRTKPEGVFVGCKGAER